MLATTFSSYIYDTFKKILQSQSAMNNFRYLLKGFLLFISIPLAMCKSTSLREEHTQTERSKQLSMQSIPSVRTLDRHPDSSDGRRIEQQKKELKQMYKTYRKEVKKKEAQFREASICQGCLILLLCISQYAGTSKKSSSQKKNKTKKN